MEAKKQRQKMTLVAVVSFFILHSSFFIPTRTLAKPGATLFLDPELDTFAVEDVKTIALEVNTGGEAINAVEATIAYPTHQLEVVSVARGPLLKIWAQEPVQDAQKGTIKFAGGIPNPGFKGAGEVLVLKVKARVAGDIPLVITSGAVLANDGKGTNVLSSLGGGLYHAQPRQIWPQIVAPPKDIAPTGVTPQPLPSPPRLVKGKVDKEPPHPFVVQVFEGARSSCITPTLAFQTFDSGSGLARYRIALDNRELGSIEINQHTGFVKLPVLEKGLHTAVVVAEDALGNTLARTATFEVAPVPPPEVQGAPRRLKPNATLQVWGTTPAGAELEGALVKDQEAAQQTIRVLVNQEGAWNYVHPDTLEEGRYTLTLVARDRCGSVSPPTAVKFRVTSESYFAPITKSFTRAVEATPAFFQPITSSFKTVFSDVADWLGRLFGI